MTLVVGPGLQGHGLGRAMIERSRSRSEKDGFFVLVHSSKMAWQACQAWGFKIMKVLKLWVSMRREVL